MSERFFDGHEIGPPQPSWMLHAACRGQGCELWFPEDESGEEADLARGVCSACSVRDRCLDHAVAAGIHYGLWGGLSGEERAALARRRYRQARRGPVSDPGPAAA